MSDVRQTHGLWESSAPKLDGLPALDTGVETDVIIVGAGYTGLSAALHLAARGVRCLVLEARHVGHGGSGRNVGLVNAGLWLRPSHVKRALPQHGGRLLEQLGAAPSLVFGLIERYAIECQATRQGTLHCAVGRAGLKDVALRAEEWRALGAPVQLLDARAAASRIGSSAFSGALLDLRAGTIQPLAYARGLARTVLGLGVRIYESSPVLTRVDKGARWQLTTPQGTVTGHKVLVTSNAYSTGPWRSLRSELVGLSYFNIATEPLSADLRARILPGREGLWDSRAILSSLRLDADGRLVFGSVGSLGGLASVHRDWAKRALGRLFPDLPAMRFEHEWFGRIGMTNDAVPRFHRLARDTYSISGYNGRGIAPGTFFGRELAELAAGERAEADLSLPLTPVMPAAGRRLRELFYDVGSSLAHLGGARS